MILKEFSMGIVALLVIWMSGCSSADFETTNGNRNQDGTVAAKTPKEQTSTITPMPRSRPPEKGTNPKFEKDHDTRSDEDDGPPDDGNRPEPQAPRIVSTPIKSFSPWHEVGGRTVLDLTTFTDVFFAPQLDDGPAAPWEKTKDKAVQVPAGEATGLISPMASLNKRFEGVFYTSGWDDDMFGLFFSYQDKRRSYLFEWKKGDQGGTIDGMCISKLDYQNAEGPTVNDGLWTKNHPGKVELSCNSLGWEKDIRYRFVLSTIPGTIRLAIYDQAELLEEFIVKDDSYTSGSFGLYAYSQDMATFEAIKVSDLRGSDYKYPLEVVDPDSRPSALVFELEEAPPGMTIDAQGIVTWPSDQIKAGVHDIAIRVTDETNQYDVQKFQIDASEL